MTERETAQKMGSQAKKDNENSRQGQDHRRIDTYETFNQLIRDHSDQKALIIARIDSCKSSVRFEDEHLRLTQKRERDFDDFKLELLAITERMAGVRATFRDKVIEAVDQKVLFQDVQKYMDCFVFDNDKMRDLLKQDQE